MPLTADEQVIVNYVRTLLGFFDRIAVFDEILVPVDAARLKFKTCYRDWDPTQNPIIYLNDGHGSALTPAANPILVEGVDYTYDPELGEVDLEPGVFPTGLRTGDVLKQTYQFRYFSDADFENFIATQIAIINSRKPITNYVSVTSVPLELNASLILGIYLLCLERLWLDQHLWKAALIYMDITASRNLISAQIQATRAEYDIIAKKPRSLTSPAAISSGKYYTLQRVEGDNFRQFTILGGP